MKEKENKTLTIKHLKLIFALIITSTSLHAKINRDLQLLDSAILGPYQFVQKGHDLSRQDQAKAIVYFEEGARYFLAKGDSAWYLKSTLGISDVYKNMGQYYRSFEIIWNIQSQAEKLKDQSPLIDIERKLGVLYGLYGKDSLALQHLKRSLRLAQHNYESTQWTSSYLAIAKQYLDMQEHDASLLYLDSCYIIKPSDKRLIYIDAFYGSIYTHKGEYDKAEHYLKDLIPIFQDNGLAFLAKVYMFYGDLAQAKGQTNKAIKYYEQAIAASDRMVVHTEIKPYTLENLAELNFRKKRLTEAYKYMKMAKELSEQLFHTQSEKNKVLFEIKSKYQEQLDRKEAELENQHQLLLLKDKASRRLQLMIVILIVLTIIAMVSIKQRYRVNSMLETRKKNESIIELRNKELTSNALQIIEKDQTVNELLELIKKELPNKYVSMNHKFKMNNEKIWNDFHLRFTQTNDDFYNKLLKKHPALTPNDIRYCALIKLNFDNSEIAHILSVSLHSVHMARYRIRKKLNIAKEESLTNYITKT